MRGKQGKRVIAPHLCLCGGTPPYNPELLNDARLLIVHRPLSYPWFCNAVIRLSGKTFSTFLSRILHLTVYFFYPPLFLSSFSPPFQHSTSFAILQALYKFDATDPTDLALMPGDLIDVDRIDAGEWGMGENYYTTIHLSLECIYNLSCGAQRPLL